MTRSEHLAWCKERAMQEFDFYVAKEGFEAAARNAKASILSDLGKHPETADSQKTAAMLLFMPVHSREEVRRLIEGFN